MKNLVDRAREFAAQAHASVNQRRKYTDQPYIVHPAEVAKILSDHGCTDVQIAAGWLHDVVEDTGVQLSEIKNEFGKEVADLVYWCTDVSTPADGNRAQRKALDREHTSRGLDAAHDIKLADMISNIQSIAIHDAKFAQIYLEEKRMLFAMIGGRDSLRKQAAKTLEWAETLLEK